MKIKKIYISFEKHIFMQKMLQIKYKSFLNIYSFYKKKKILIIKDIFVKTVVNSTIGSLKFRKHPICGIP